ncbi:MAG: InlB B-repeat-containing protein [Lachnospiraceae bacterium]|nr:InlB B-repeat-containing protein [Lachnospiraceae bacterium]
MQKTNDLEKQIFLRKSIRLGLTFILAFALSFSMAFLSNIKSKAEEPTTHISYNVEYAGSSLDKWKLDNITLSDVSPGAITITYPKEFNISFDSNLLSGWHRKDSTSDASPYAAISLLFDQNHNWNTSIENTINLLSSATITLKNPGVYPKLDNSKIQINIFNGITGRNIEYIDENGEIHYYQLYTQEFDDWYAAYNCARSQTCNGLPGYLATFTSPEEYSFLYNSSLWDASDFFIGGTKLRFQNANKMINNETSISPDELSNDLFNTGNWYWASGPEAGQVFYTVSKYSSGNGMNDNFSYFSNPDTYNKYSSNWQTLLPLSIPQGTEPSSGDSSLDSQSVLGISGFGSNSNASWDDIDASRNGYPYIEYSTNFPEGSSKFTSPVSIPIPATVKFDIQNVNYTGTINTQYIKLGDLAKNPTSNLVIGKEYPEYGDMIFTGWYTDKEETSPYDFSTPIESNLTLYAGWTQSIVSKKTDCEGLISHPKTPLKSVVQITKVKTTNPSSPKTADTSRVTLWMLLSLLAVTVSVASIRKIANKNININI